MTNSDESKANYVVNVQFKQDAWAKLHWTSKNKQLAKLTWESSEPKESEHAAAVKIPAGQLTTVEVKRDASMALSLSVSQPPADPDPDDPAPTCFGPCPEFFQECQSGLPDCSSGRLKCIE